MSLIIGNYILDINIEETKDYYIKERYISDGCDCDGCQNYERAADQITSEVSNLFEKMGIDIKKPSEVYVNYSENNILCYGGFYHICGKIIKGESPWVIISNTEDVMVSHLAEENMIDIASNYKVAFHDQCSLLNKSFPRPCIQMEILAYIPWVLSKRNSFED